jgi:hypothetical protein
MEQLGVLWLLETLGTGFPRRLGCQLLVQAGALRKTTSSPRSSAPTRNTRWNAFDAMNNRTNRYSAASISRSEKSVARCGRRVRVDEPLALAVPVPASKRPAASTAPNRSSSSCPRARAAYRRATARPRPRVSGSTGRRTVPAAAAAAEAGD